MIYKISDENKHLADNRSQRKYVFNRLNGNNVLTLESGERNHSHSEQVLIPP